MRLEKLCTVFTDGDWIESKDQSISGIRLIQTGNIGDGIYLEKEERAKYISEDTFERLKCTEVFSGDVLVSRLPEPVGRACIIPEKNERMITAVDCSICRPNEDIISKEYLCYFMRSRAYFTKLLGNVTGTTRKRISRKNLGNIELDVHSKEEQNEVVKRLNCLVKVINLRNKEIQLLDQFIRARFVEMFGDRYVNDKKWNTTKLGEGISFNNGKAHEQVVDENGDYILVTSRAIASDFEDVRRTNTLLFPLHKNDIVMVMSDVPNGKALAKCQLIDSDDKYTLNQRICSFDNYEYNAIFLLYLLNRHPYFLAFNDGNGQTNLRKNDILECELIVPPIELQNQFADFVRQVDKSKLSPKQSTTLHYKSIFTQTQTLQITNIFYLETESEAFHQNDKRRIISMGKTRIWHGSGISVEGFERSAASGG